MAAPGGYYIRNADGTTSGPFYDAQPAAMYVPQPASVPHTAPGAYVTPGMNVTTLPATQAPFVPTSIAGGTAYFATSVQAAWDNHFDAFGKQDLDKILLDYDETSIAKLYNTVDGSKKEFAGLQGIRDMFTDLFKDLSDLKTLEAPVIEVDEPGKTVFLVWKCPGCGYSTATDTFVFGPDFKVKRQNIVVAHSPVQTKAKTEKKGMCA
ncbi:unnamed protein product [Durusdinium trenchii]|uniref:Metacaspase-1B n=2 Tax=Durusdinium trenchii TaxID=1381693 RepID=A0ABP0JZA5_9DINO